MMNINKEMVKDGAVIVAKATKESANKCGKEMVSKKLIKSYIVKKTK